MTDTDLRDRLAKEMKDRLAKVPRVLHSHGGSEGAYRRNVARGWADECLTDLNAAIALLSTHWSGDWGVLFAYDTLVYHAWLIERPNGRDEPKRYSAKSESLSEAICRAFVEWRDAQEVTA